MKWWWNNDEMMMKYLNVNLSALSTHANHATPCVTSKLRSHPPHLWDLLLPARSPPALLKLRHLWSGQKWCSCNSSPSLFIIESVLSIFIRFIWIFKLLSINKNHAQLLPDAGDRASGRTSTWKACVFPIAGWNQVLFEFSSNLFGLMHLESSPRSKAASLRASRAAS